MKIALNLPDNLVAKAKTEAHARGISMTEVIRRGLETELFLFNEEKPQGRMLIEKADGKIVELVRM